MIVIGANINVLTLMKDGSMDGATIALLVSCGIIGGLTSALGMGWLDGTDGIVLNVALVIMLSVVHFTAKGM